MKKSRRCIHYAKTINLAFTVINVLSNIVILVTHYDTITYIYINKNIHYTVIYIYIYITHYSILLIYSKLFHRKEHIKNKHTNIHLQ